jgi:hypothetical protein
MRISATALTRRGIAPTGLSLDLGILQAAGDVLAQQAGVHGGL